MRILVHLESFLIEDLKKTCKEKTFPFQDS